MLSRKSFWVSPLCSFFFLASCSRPLEHLSFRGVPIKPVANSFVVQLKDSVQSSTDTDRLFHKKAQGIAASVGCNVKHIDPVVWDDQVLSESLAKTVHLTFKDCVMDKAMLEKTLKDLSDESMVEGVEAEATIRASVFENDPGRPLQGYLKPIGRDAACDRLGRSKVPEVVVAVIDSGVDQNHEDLAEAFKRDEKGLVIGANFVGKGSRFAPDSNWDDANGHGTHVAGIIAATANNSIGIAGVASCANVRIMPIRVMDESGAGSSIEIDRGVQWALSHGADVINLSLGSNVLYRSPRPSHPSALYALAAARGVAVFAAAGNDGLTLGKSRDGYVYSYPASYDHVISVAALDDRNHLARFSNRGETVDIAAPGVAILSTYMGNSYSRLSGTSMAAPVAAGAYALALSISRAQSGDTRAPASLESSLLGATDSGVINASTLATLLSAEPLAH